MHNFYVKPIQQNIGSRNVIFAKTDFASGCYKFLTLREQIYTFLPCKTCDLSRVIKFSIGSVFNERRTSERANGLNSETLNYVESVFFSLATVLPIEELFQRFVLVCNY